MSSDVLPLILFFAFITLALYLLFRLLWRLIPRRLTRSVLSIFAAFAIVLGFLNDLSEIVSGQPANPDTIWKPLQDLRIEIAISLCSLAPRFPQTIGYICQVESPQPQQPLTRVAEQHDAGGASPRPSTSESDAQTPPAGVAPHTGQKREDGAERAASAPGTSRITVRVGALDNNEVLMMQPGLGRIESFQDCPACPEMVVIPAGAFQAAPSAGGWVGFAEPFAIGKHEVTAAQWQACVDARWCPERPQPRALTARGNHPVVNVSYQDARDYTVWLSQKTGKSYMLPNAIRWEYAARSTSTGRYWWQRNEINALYANYRGSKGMGSIGPLEAVDSYPPNFWGLHNVHGNAAEWVHDCATGNCDQRAVRGGSREDYAQAVTAAAQIYMADTASNESTGFRVMRELANAP